MASAQLFPQVITHTTMKVGQIQIRMRPAAINSTIIRTPETLLLYYEIFTRNQILPSIVEPLNTLYSNPVK